MIDTKLPKTIRIGPFDYKIVILSAVETVEKNVYGECANLQQEIRMRAKYESYSACADTFIHECLHALWWIMNIKEADNEERVVTTLATGLTMLLRDNDWLAAWLNRFNK